MGRSAPAAFPAIANVRDAEHWLHVFKAERREVLDALHDLQQRFAAEVSTPRASWVPRRGGGLIWRLRAAVPSGQTLFELTSVTGRSLACDTRSLEELSPRRRRGPPVSNHSIGRGNLGADPELKHVDLEGESRRVAELRIYFDRPIPNGEGGFTDKGGFWLPANLWGPKAQVVARHLRKGARVRVEGTLVQDTWEDKEGVEVSRIEVRADSVDLDLARVEAVTFRSKTDTADADSDQVLASAGPG